MKKTTINRIDYKNLAKKTDFEIVDVQLFFATRSHKKLESDYRLNFWSIIYITEGSGVHYVDFEQYDYKKGSVIFIQMNQVQRFQVNPTVKGYILNIDEPFFYSVEGFGRDVFLEFVDRSFGSPLSFFDVSKNRTNRILIELIYQKYSKSAYDLNEKLIATLFQGLLLDLRDQSPSENVALKSKDYENFKTYRRLVESHYAETRNVEDYANMMMVSSKTINQATRKVAALSAKQYIVNRIILEIKRYLSQGELMNYEISDMLGFGEPANMTKFFKRYEGVSPKDFKESLSQD